MTARLEDDGSWFRDTEAVLFIWTVFPYRAEWRHGVLSHKMMALDAGHICQNLYLASEAIGAFWQDEADTVLDVDGENKFPLYVARVGRI